MSTLPVSLQTGARSAADVSKVSIVAPRIIPEFPTCKSAEFRHNFLPRLAGTSFHERCNDCRDRLQIVFRHNQTMTAPYEAIFLARPCKPFGTANGQVELLTTQVVGWSDCEAEGATEIGRIFW